MCIRDSYKVLQAKDAFMAQHQREPTVDEIAAVLGIRREDIVFALDAIVDPVSMYEPVYSDNGDTPVSYTHLLHSMGMHLFMPLNDAISMDLAEQGKVGAMMGRFKSVNTVVTMLAACAVFVGFRTGIFSFAAPVILPFVIAALAAGAAIVLLAVMARGMGSPKGRTHRCV